jgi:hypothetical protein
MKQQYSKDALGCPAQELAPVAVAHAALRVRVVMKGQSFDFHETGTFER